MVEGTTNCERCFPAAAAMLANNMQNIPSENPIVIFDLGINVIINASIETPAVDAAGFCVIVSGTVARCCKVLDKPTMSASQQGSLNLYCLGRGVASVYHEFRARHVA